MKTDLLVGRRWSTVSELVGLYRLSCVGHRCLSFPEVTHLGGSQPFPCVVLPCEVFRVPADRIDRLGL